MSFSINPLRKGKLKFSLSGTSTVITAVGKTLIEMEHATTPGETVILDITGLSWTCDWAAYIANAGLGITTTVDWQVAMPHFWYLGNTANTAAGVAAFTTRDPRMSVTPADTLINATNEIASGTQAQTCINSWTTIAAMPKATLAAKPCVCIGSSTFFWETDAAPVADVWEAQTLTTEDGFGKYQEGVQFVQPISQNGATAGKYFVDNGGTAPVFSTNAYEYTVTREGMVSVTCYFNADGGTDGATAVITQLAAPMAGRTTAGPASQRIGHGTATGQTTISTAPMIQVILSSASSLFTFVYESAAATTQTVLNSYFTNGARTVHFNATYQAF